MLAYIGTDAGKQPADNYGYRQHLAGREHWLVFVLFLWGRLFAFCFFLAVRPKGPMALVLTPPFPRSRMESAAASFLFCFTVLSYLLALPLLFVDA